MKGIIFVIVFLLGLQIVNAQTNSSTGSTFDQLAPLFSVLILIGIYLIVFGAFAPGHGSEMAGVILFVVGLVGLGFAVDTIAISLLIFGLILMFFESSSPGFGIFGLAGVIFLILGSALLIATGLPRYNVSPEFTTTLILIVSVPPILFGIFLAFALTKVIQIRKKESVFGRMSGKEATALENISPKKKGFVKYQGEYWKASSKNIVKSGERVRILEKSGHTLIVEKK